MDINCMENKITTANGILQPTIITAILNLYNGGLRLMTARNVKEECRKIDKMTPWDKRIKAIYNAMRNATECGGRIIGENKPSNNFTIAFDGNIKNLISLNVKPIPKVTIIGSKLKTTMENNEIELSKNFKVVMICASSKNIGSELIYNGQIIHFRAQSNVAMNEFLPDDQIPDTKITWRDFVLANQNNNIIPYTACNLYQRDVYRLLNIAFGNRFFILSAGWGLVKADFKLPKYDITFSNAANIENKRIYNQIQPAYNDFNLLENTNDNEDIIYIGGKDYLNLFYALTQDLPNRKIIYWKSKNIPMPQVNVNSFVFRYYKINRNTNWHYELAGRIANVDIP